MDLKQEKRQKRINAQKFPFFWTESMHRNILE